MKSADPTAAGRDFRSLDDKELVQAIVERRSTAVAELYDRFSSILMALAQRILGDRSEAEEILQETFLQVWRQADRYDPGRSSVSTWLVMIARSRAIDRVRSRRVRDRTRVAAQRESVETHTSPQGVRSVLRGEQRHRLQEELGRLPEEQRQVLELAFYQGLTQSEIARQTEIPLGTVKTRTLLAMRKLRIALQDEIKDLL